MGKAVKISEELVQAAEQEAARMSRSVARQIEHWALLGRSLERSGQVSYRQILGFLEGVIGYDQLTGSEQAVALDQLVEGLEEARVEPEFFDKLARSGLGYSGRQQGQIVRRER